MQIEIKVDGTTTSAQFNALGFFFTMLGAGNGVLGSASNAQQCLKPGPIELVKKEETVTQYSDDGMESVQVQAQTAQPQERAQPTRRRRTKAEIEVAKAAEEAAPPAEEKPAETTEPAPEPAAEAEAKAQEDAISGEAAQSKVDTDTGEITIGDEKAFSEAEVQQLAAVIARTKGADVVKNKIAELGGTRISALTAAQLNSLGAFLESQK